MPQLVSLTALTAETDTSAPRSPPGTAGQADVTCQQHHFMLTVSGHVLRCCRRFPASRRLPLTGPGALRPQPSPLNSNPQPQGNKPALARLMARQGSSTAPR